MDPTTQNIRFLATINAWKSKLLDLSKRNRALNFKINKVSTITIIEELPIEIFKLLCGQKKSLKFKPSDEPETKVENEFIEADVLFDEIEDDTSQTTESQLSLFVPYNTENLTASHTDDFLQTNSSAEKLDKSLRRLEEQARTIVEEQGVNALFLALGMLHYKESKDSEVFFKAPMILVPVELSRKSAREGFAVKATDEEIIVNPSLIEYLQRNYGIALPEIDTSGENYDLQDFFQNINEAISKQKDWKITNEIYLALFSFQKLVMYKDIEKNSGKVAAHKIFKQMINREGDNFIGLPDEIRDLVLDKDFPPESSSQVVDADSSQLRAIATVAKNYDLILEGPPGTGKSQTITNLIAQALSTGKSVLFVAEKMAALEVVYRRLVNVGLGEFCLELHSTKANKRSVMQQLKNTLDASLQTFSASQTATARLPVVRDLLTNYTNAVHQSYGVLNVSPYRIYGELDGVLNAPKILFHSDIFNVTTVELTNILREIDDLTAAAEFVGTPQKHPWRETTKTFYSENNLDEIKWTGTAIVEKINALLIEAEKLESVLGLPPLQTFADIETASVVAATIARSPGAPFEVLSSEAWHENAPPEALTLIQKGHRIVKLRKQASYAQVLSDESYQNLSSESQKLIELGRKINNLREEVLKAQVLSNEMYENFSHQVQQLIEDAYKVIKWREQASQVQVLSNKMYDEFSHQAHHLIEEGQKVISLYEQALKVQVISNQIYDKFPLEAQRLIAKGQKVIGLHGRVAKNFNTTVIEQDPTDDIAYIEQKSSGFFSFLSFLDGRYRAIKKRWLSYRLPTYQSSLIEQVTDMKTVAELWRERREFEAHSALGQQLFGSLWQGEESNWNVLEKYTSWIISFRHLCLEENFNNLQLLEKEAENLRLLFAEHQQLKGLSSSYVTSWDSMEKDLKSVSNYLREKQSLEMQNALGSQVFGSLWQSKASNWKALENYMNWVLKLRQLCIENNLHKSDSTTADINVVNAIKSLEKEAETLSSNFVEYCQSTNLTNNYLISWYAIEKDLQLVAQYFYERQNLKEQESTGIALFGSLWQGEKSNLGALEKYVVWVSSFRRLCLDNSSTPNINELQSVEMEAAALHSIFLEHCRADNLPQNYLTTWEVMENDLRTLGKYLRERQNLKEQDSLGVAIFGSLWEGENSNWSWLEKYADWMIGFRELCRESNLHTPDLTKTSNLAESLDDLSSLEKKAFEMRSALVEYQHNKGLPQNYLTLWETIEKDLLAVAEYLREKQNLEVQNTTGKEFFGALWQDEASDWNALERYVKWVLEFRQIYVRQGLKEQAISTATTTAPDVGFLQTLRQNAIEINELLKKFCASVGWREDYFDNAEVKKISARVTEITDNLALAPRWASFESVRQKIEKSFAAEILNWVIGGQISFADLSEVFRRAFYQKWLTQVVGERPELREFYTLTHEQRVKEFQDLDEKVLRQNRSNLVGQMRGRLQANLQQPVIQEQMNILRRELNRQRGLSPLRLTMQRCLNVIHSIKPCFMMSPQTVAQLLDSEKAQFDLILFDEASQLPTEDAVGAIIRGKQLVVVGDPKQLPPTNFFAVASGQVNVQTDADGLPLFEDSQSILEEVLSSGVPSNRLKWHYQSAHESLITFSNVSFYDSELYTFPSVETDAYNSGLHFEFVTEGIYEGKGLNMIEARRVADAVVEHAKKNPQTSLGVGTFNMRQQLAIQDELEQRRREDISLEPFFDRSKKEPFFVKNLENIQGDERDVIFLSVTYAKAHDGKLRYNFGPLNGENGWRRMNVLTTRARKLMRVFSSIKAENINLAATASRGAKLLRDFLTYAEYKRLDSPIVSAMAEMDSPFEQEVYRELSNRGFSLIPQVGASGYKIDFGVVDDVAQGKFVCGIECDGVAYHSSQTARDRDRLRQQVLEARGWEIHRVWSTDWFKDRAGQIERLLNLIEQSRERAKKESEQETERQTFLEAENEQQAREFLGELSETEIGSIFENLEQKNYIRPIAEPYRMAQTDIRFNFQSLLEAATQQIAQVVMAIVEQEAPMHVKDVFTRTASVWGQKAGSNISARIMEILRLLEQAKHIELRGEFVWKIGGEIRVRSRNNIPIPAERIAPEEIREAILLILSNNHKFNQQNLVNEVRTIFGFNRTGASLQQTIEQAIDNLLIEGVIGEGSTGIGLRT
ncbi:MAG: DUF3320 domain-containing protein [Acidobacteria bacterium]|nr:DUF3320 domain-containing protein [Acidobacteriota bacterium]